MQQSKGPVRPLSLIPDFNYKPSILLDSGAYTAWRVGKPIPVEEYADFLIQHEDRLFSYFNLDEINPMDREAAAKISLKNFKYLKGRGLNPIPVFHQGEDMKWLDLMLDSGADYVALSGASTLRGAGRMFDWYDIVWNRLVNTGGLPYVKVHGLADTLENSLRTYPFYSTDSSTWAQNTGKGGNLFLDFGPMPSVRGWDKGQNFSIGVRNDGLHSKTRKDIDGLNAEELEKLAIWLEPFGVTVEHLKARKGVDHIYRLLIGMQYYKNMMNRYHNHVPKLQPRDTIVVNDVHRPNVKDIPLDGPKVFLASWLSKEFTAVFQAHDYPYVLLSYAFLLEAGSNKYTTSFQLVKDETNGSTRNPGLFTRQTQSTRSGNGRRQSGTIGKTATPVSSDLRREKSSSGLSGNSIRRRETLD